MGKVVAFVPARGGSKSIPLKNIKSLNGKPLIFWCLSSLQQTCLVDEIVVATDSDEIAKVVAGFNFSKASVYRRCAENAGDTASTESVILEYINNKKPTANTVFMLVQATSPLTQAKHFNEALMQYQEQRYDSMLSCVRTRRFFWNADGTPKSYDYRNRPRRQDFEGELMENGAFYINTVENILRDSNRLSGNIGLYEMPEYTAAEIDEPHDWTILESLMRKYPPALSQKKQIKLFLSDVDGVLTDAGMYYTENGDELKKFNTQDGMGFMLLKNAGIKTGIITSENTKIVERRSQKLKVDYLCQGEKHGGKLAAAQKICEKEGISLEEVAYIGDDVNCFELLSAVGLAACPANAVEQIKAIPGIVLLEKKGGDGAVREFIGMIL